MYANNNDFLGHAHRKRQEIAKSIYNSYNKQEESQDDSLEKGKKAAPIGTISNGYKKVAEGKWQKVSDKGKTRKEHLDSAQSHLDRASKHAEKNEDSSMRSAEEDYQKELNYAKNVDDKEYDDTHVEGAGNESEQDKVTDEQRATIQRRMRAKLAERDEEYKNRKI